jgi:hypothetical protein
VINHLKEPIVDQEDKLEITTITSNSITPEDVSLEARRIAMRLAGILAIGLGEKRITEKQLAAQLEVNPRQVRQLLVGENYKSYLAIAAVFLALGIELDLRTN